MERTDLPYVMIDGKIVPQAEGQVSVSSAAFRYAASVFEGIRGYYNKEKDEVFLFRARDHIRRLFQSTRMMRMNLAYTEQDFLEGINEVIRKNQVKCDVHLGVFAYISGPGWFTVREPVSMCILVSKVNRYFGVGRFSCSVSSWRKNEDSCTPPRIKATANYVNSRLALIEAEDAGYDHTILLNTRGKVAESPVACFFMVREQNPVTPSLNNDILESITRSTLLVLFKEVCGVEVIERDIDRTELYLAEEAFITGTGAEITPITHIDRLQVGKGSIGPLTKVVKKAYLDVVYQRVPKHTEWISTVYGN